MTVRARVLRAAPVVVVACLGCGREPVARAPSDVSRGWSPILVDGGGATQEEVPALADADLPERAVVLVVDHGSGRGAQRQAALRRGTSGAEPERGKPPDGMFRNTYYDFPSEGDGPKEVTLFDGTCRSLASVPRAFHEAVCVQGSGRLASGATVSFARRNCPCASVCPRTGQRICFDALDARRFPHGRGASGRPITPLRTVAVDSDVIPLGSVLFIPELVGLPGPAGTRHDGCVVAEDRGSGVLGRQIDVFMGAPSTTAVFNALLPSNQGVHVFDGDARCAYLSR